MTSSRTARTPPLSRLLLVITAGHLCLGCRPAAAPPVAEGCRMGECHRIFIQDRERQGVGRWRFRTRTEIRRDPRGGLVAEPPADQRRIIGDWQVADCFRSTIDGQLVPAVARSGVERGLPSLLQAICRSGDD